METVVHFTRVSRNEKTGPIPVTTSSAETCPDSCPLKDSGCYAQSGPISWHWKKVSNGERGAAWSALCEQIDRLPRDQVWRHNQAGDLPHTGGDIDTAALWQLVAANTGKQGFTYTHHHMDNENNREAVELANLYGLRVNLSANDLQHADELAALGIAPVVTVLPEDQTENTTTPAGRKVVVCPATLKGSSATCETCKMCTRERTAIIGFPAHGTNKRKASVIAAGCQS